MIGTKITITKDYEGAHITGMQGTVIKSRTFGDGELSYLIAIDNWNKGHEGSDKAAISSFLIELMTGNNCWWMPATHFIQTDINPNYKKKLIIDKVLYLEEKFKNRKAGINHVSR